MNRKVDLTRPFLGWISAGARVCVTIHDADMGAAGFSCNAKQGEPDSRWHLACHFKDLEQEKWAYTNDTVGLFFGLELSTTEDGGKVWPRLTVSSGTIEDGAVYKVHKTTQATVRPQLGITVLLGQRLVQDIGREGLPARHTRTIVIAHHCKPTDPYDVDLLLNVSVVDRVLL